VPPRHDNRRDLLSDEQGRIQPAGPALVALLYPSPYHVALSSLGLQTIYRIINESGDLGCERFTAPDKGSPWDARQAPCSLESGRTLSCFPVIAASVACEAEIAGLAGMLETAGLGALREERSDAGPIVIAGGPLTFSNPLPLAAIVDAVVMGEADAIALGALRTALSEGSRAERLRALAELPHVVVPSLHGDGLKPLARAPDELLPAWGPIRTPNTELRNMFLIEAVRGCSRGCRYCVMSRNSGCGMRVIPIERILGRIPADAARVGLVGASVSDHPAIAELVETLADRGVHVGLSSLRADRLSERLVGALKRAGYRTLTTAMDGASERLRALLDRNTTEQQLTAVAERARAAGIERLKLYLMVGVPEETDEDIVECAEFVRTLSRTLPVSIGISPFCPKRGTPLADAPFAGMHVIDQRLALLRGKVAGRAEVRATSARWAWVEAVLAQGGQAEGRAAVQAARAGGGFSDWRRAFEALGHKPH
jgi:radical SAM superfamily enzyme YgiQ (UPF0313 family)